MTLSVRVQPIFRPSDSPASGGESLRREIDTLFAQLFPGAQNPSFDEAHAGLAILARNPPLASQVAKLGAFIARDVPWCQRHDLRALAVQAVNRHFRCEFSYRLWCSHAEAAGISPEQLAAIPAWRTSPLFDDEQRLTLAYTNAVASGTVPAEIFASVVERFGEKGAVEFTTAVAWWSFWAMILNATIAEQPADATE